MTSIRLDADGCRAAILGYRRTLRGLVALLRHAGRIDAQHPAHAGLADLRRRLEADVAARSTLEGQGRMTALEARVLEPALRQARIALAFPVAADADAWITHLQAADACFVVALSQLQLALPGAGASTSERWRRRQAS
jgi:hypothetical protein